MYKSFILFILIFSVTLSAKSEYAPFINQQILYIEEMNENNVSQAKIEAILLLQKQSYTDVIDEVMSVKKDYIKNTVTYESEIFALKKMIKINKRARNKYAVARDEIKVASYVLVKNQNLMLKEVLSSLDYTDAKGFEKKLNDSVVKNQLQNQEMAIKDYSYLLEIKSGSKVLAQAILNLEEFNALIEINQDVISYLYFFENKMYRLNKYSKYHLISPVLYVNSISVVKLINPFLEKVGLNVIKLLSILFLISSIYFIRKVVYVSVEKLLLQVEFLEKYAKNILDAVRRLIGTVILTINLNMITYVYNDFSSVEALTKTFNVLYGIFFTLFVYKVLNTVAKIKVHEIDAKENKIKNEIVNVGIKIANFIIMLIGFLIVLYFAGVNLTAVLSGLGIGGFAVALAAKDSLANFFGTLSILLSDVFSQGDWIVIDGNEGVVVEIGLRVTTLRTFDNALVAIPNAILANQDVKNWNKRELGRRIKMSLGVKYDSKSQDIKNAISEIRVMLNKHTEIATENTKYVYSATRAAKLVSQDDSHGVKKTLLVYLDEFSDSSINILVYCFAKSTDWDDWLKTKEDVMHRIMAIFENNNLEFAFPSMSLYHETNVPKIADSD